MKMQLKVLLPTHVEVDEEVSKITAEGAAGSFTLLPRHADVVTDLAPGLLLFETAGGEGLLAVNAGTLVKCGEEVLVSTPNAVRSSNLTEVLQAIKDSFERVSEREHQARVAFYKIEADLIRRFVELQEHG